MFTASVKAPRSQLSVKKQTALSIINTLVTDISVSRCNCFQYDHEGPCQEATMLLCSIHNNEHNTGESTVHKDTGWSETLISPAKTRHKNQRHHNKMIIKKLTRTSATNYYHHAVQKQGRC